MFFFSTCCLSLFFTLQFLPSARLRSLPSVSFLFAISFQLSLPFSQSLVFLSLSPIHTYTRSHISLLCRGDFFLFALGLAFLLFVHSLSFLLSHLLISLRRKKGSLRFSFLVFFFFASTFCVSHSSLFSSFGKAKR